MSVDERRNVVDQVAKKAGWNPMIRNFAMLLLDNDRFGYVSGISEELDELVDVHAGNVRAHVTTASAQGIGTVGRCDRVDQRDDLDFREHLFDDCETVAVKLRLDWVIKHRAKDRLRRRR